MRGAKEQACSAAGETYTAAPRRYLRKKGGQGSKVYEWQRNQLRAAGFVHDWIFISLCIKEKMRKHGIKTIPLTGYYSPSSAKTRQITYEEGSTACLEK